MTGNVSSCRPSRDRDPVAQFKLVLLHLLLVFPVVSTGQRSPGSMNRVQPNMVFILIDDLRWDELGCVGHPSLKTPNIDRIAREGALFCNAFTTTPLCSPSRASFLTGQYAHTHGITDNVDRSPASHKLATFPPLLHQAGYETAFIGKWRWLLKTVSDRYSMRSRKRGNWIIRSSSSPATMDTFTANTV